LRRVGTDRDALGWLVIRSLGQARREEGPDALDSKVNHILSGLKKRFDLDTNMDADDFKAWYRERTGRPFTAENSPAAKTTPLAGPKASFLERMAIEVMLAREKHLVSLEAKLLGEYRRVLVVYGAGHLVYQEAVLRNMLGPPVRISSKWQVKVK